MSVDSLPDDANLISTNQRQAELVKSLFDIIQQCFTKKHVFLLTAKCYFHNETLQ